MPRIILAATALLLAVVPHASAQEITGDAIARHYMATADVPQGWVLSYKGMDGGTVVFVMDRDLDAFPRGAAAKPQDAFRTLMCADEQLRALLDGGTVFRVDTRDKRGGKRTTTAGPELTGC